jgi:hypothetical protein
VDGCVTVVMMKSLPAEHTNDGFAHTLLVMKGFTTLIIYIDCLDIVVKKLSRIRSRFMVLSLPGEFETCKEFEISKAGQKYVSKNWLGSSDIPGEHLYIDISSIKERSFGGAKFRALILDNYTDFCWRYVLKKV